MDARTRIAGLLWPLLDHHGDRDADDLPDEYRGQMRALYAACETYLAAEVAAVEARRGLRCARAVAALVRVVWVAGQLAGAARVTATRLAKGPPTA